jgi:hypothetical protein
MTDLAKWKGLGALVVDAVDGGSRAVERIQLKSAQRPFAILEQVPVIAPAGRAVHLVHTAAVTTVHAGVRLVARAVGTIVDVALSAGEAKRSRSASSE